LAFSPEGVLASASRDNTARVWSWDGVRWRSLALRGHTAAVEAVAFADRGLLATAGADWLVRLWSRDGRTWRDGGTLSGHGAPVTGLAFARDGRALVSLAPYLMNSPAEVRLWDVHARNERKALTLPGLQANVALAPDGKQAAAAAGEGTVRVWDLPTGKVLASLRSGPAGQVAFAPHAPALAVACADRTVQLWRPAGAGWRKGLTLSGHTDTVWAVAFSADGKMLASGSYDRTVRLWDVATGARAVLPGSSDRVLAVAFSPDGRNVAAAGEDGVVRLWDVSRWVEPTGRELVRAPRVLRSLPRKADFARPGVKLDADGFRIATKERDRSVLLFEVARPKVEAGLLLYRARVKADGVKGRAILEMRCRFPRAGEFTVRQRWPESVAGKEWALRTLPFRLEKGERPDRVRLAVHLPEAGTVWLKDVDLAFVPLPADQPRARRSLRGHAGWVWSVAFSPDGQTLATAGQDGTVVVWVRRGGAWEKKATLRGHRAAVRAVAFARGGRLLATASDDRAVKLWQRAGAGWKERATLTGHGKRVVALAFSPDGKLLASASETWPERTPGEVKVWDVARRKQRASFTAHTGPIKDVLFTPDGKILVTACQDQTVKLWDTATWAEKAVLKVEAGRAWAAAFAPDGKTLAGSAGERVVLWRREGPRWRDRAVPWSHAALIDCLAFSPGGKLLASGAEDGTIKLWDLTTRRERGRVRGHAARVCSLAFSPDGKTLASASWDGAVKLWDVDRWPAPPPASKGEPAGAFVVLAGDGAAGRAFDTLAEAVAAAGPGDTVEVRGNGPFISAPVRIGKKPLRLRAGKGFRPVLQLDLEGEDANRPLLHTEGALVVEGLTLQRCGTNVPRSGPWSVMVQVAGAPVYAANCRFLVRNHSLALHAFRAPVCDVRNSAFLRSGGWYASIEHGFADGGTRSAVANCVFAGGTWALFTRRWGPRQPGDSVVVRHSTLVTPGALAYFLDAEPDLPKPAARPAGPPVRIEARENVFDTTWAGILQFDHNFLVEKSPLSPARAEALLKRLARWHDGGNLYPVTGNLLRLSRNFQWDEGVRERRSLAAWAEFWGGSEHSRQGAARYRGGDLRTRVVRAPESLSAEDFRLLPASPGRGAGAGGRDLGADVDLVGPGPAYERWQKTAAYRAWLEQTRRVLAGKE
jgi:WD40 repeat protein